MEEDKKPDETIIETPEVETLAAPPQKPAKSTADSSKWQRFKEWYTDHKKWSVPLSVIVLILILAAIPTTRYGIAGTLKKDNIELKITDSTANTPVSGATVSIGSISAETDSSGMATLRGVRAGHHNATISKKYYQSQTVSVLAPIFSQKAAPQFQLTATGRQVKIDVVNLIDKTALSNVDIKVAGTSAKTDKTGSATIVLPPDQSSQKASLSLSGYNDAQVTVKISDDKIQDNQFSLIPAGKIYFLSNLSGKIDVVKTNLDGTDRQTVMAGTGNEDDRNTVLLGSRDWKYLALLSRRAGDKPSLYVIKTADDSLSTIDSGNADFDLAGWVGSDFVYTVTRNDRQLWQPGRQVLKSYDAAAKKLTVLDQTSASGSDLSDYLGQQIGSVYAYGSQILYVKQWGGGYTMDASPQLAAKASTFNSVNPDGTAEASIKSFTAAKTAQSFDVNLDAQVVTPNSFELYFYDGLKDNFYTYANGQVRADSTETAAKYYSGSNVAYLLSPSGNQTFWSEPRDGKNTLFIGDQYGEDSKQIATLSDFSPYGWYTDSYLLVSKNGSELYIMAKSGSQTPVKISDYHKPAQTFYGYGGGYGGL